MGDFDLSNILVNVNLKDRSEVDPATGAPKSYETEEYGGFLLMMATVPEKSSYDYGLPYLRLFSTFIPRIIWPSKPIFGRDKWQLAWVAGSEFPRDMTFTGPAIGILGALQLNGGALGTAVVLGSAGDDAARGLRVLPAVCRRGVGAGVVGGDVLQRVADDGERRSVCVVLL